MFARLRQKLAVLYGGLFCAALILISTTAYVVISGNAQQIVREQLQSTSAVFDRLWQIRFDQLQNGAELAARDYGFRQAVATRDLATMRSALQNLQQRLDADLVFLVTPDGAGINAEGSEPAPVSERLRRALEEEEAPVGVLHAGGVPHQTVTAPILAPNLIGWVIVAERLDASEMGALERLSAIPLHATALTRAPDGWRAAGTRAAEFDEGVRQFIDRPGVIHTRAGDAMALAKVLHTLDGSQSMLLIRYPLALALAPYRTLFGTLIAMGVLGLIFLLVATWLLASGITQPLSTLEAAARRLQAGHYEPVTVRTNDELSRLADSFNIMASAIQERENRITRLALTDSDTDLPNRLALERRIAARVAAGGERIFVAALGVDRFAHVRGAIGYALANVLMQRLGQRLSELAPNAPIGRLSSDGLSLAFVARDQATALDRMRRLQPRLEDPISINGNIVDIDTTIGLAAVTGDQIGQSIDRASIALDQARAARAKIAFFDETAYGDPARSLSLMGDMRRALTNGEMYLAYQPKLNLRTRTIESAEALVRWRHPGRGLVPPDLFVPMAEETGHIRPLTDWVLARAIEGQRAFASAGWPLAVSVNLSGRLVDDKDFTRAAVALVQSAPHDIWLEITETAIIDNAETALENIDVLVQAGARISIDDYGSGLSSLAYLKKLPAHELKIDKIFVSTLTNGKRDALLVRSTIDLAHGLGMKVTAEGVEHPAELALLAAMGCDMAQGYLVAHPSSVNELLTILNDDARMSALHIPAAAAAFAAR